MTKTEARKALMDLLVFKCDRCPKPRKTTNACKPCEYYPQIRACGDLLFGNDKQRKYHWSDEEKEFLLKNRNKYSLSELAKMINRSERAIQQMYLKLTSRSAKRKVAN